METFATEMSKFCSLKVTSLTKGLCTRGMRFIISNCIFYVFCRPENPRRRTSIELDEIKESLRNNGCWPFVPSGPILLETDDSDEDNNSSIVINQAPGTSEASTSSGSQKPNLTIENEKPSKGKGKGKGKGKAYVQPFVNEVTLQHPKGWFCLVKVTSFT